MSPTTYFTTALVCIVAFSSFGVSFAEGQVVTDEDTASWPEGTLATRLEHKYLEYKTVRGRRQDDGEVLDPADETNVLKHPELLETMSKKDAVKAVEEALGVSLEGSVDPEKLRKDDLIVALKTMLAEVDPKL